MNNLDLPSLSLREIICWGESELLAHSIENPRKDVLWMVEDLFNCKLHDIYIKDHTVSTQKFAKFKTWIQRRKNREPVQRITGNTEFYGYKIFVDPGVFIPRPETERLIDAVKCVHTKNDSISIFDVGTGTGCIAIALGRIFKNAYITAVDISEIALKNSKRNSEFHNLKNIKFKKRNIIGSEIKKSYDLVISNPPYIPKSEMNMLMKEVANYDPEDALTDNSDGLTFYKYFAENFNSLVKPNGYMILEVGNESHPENVLKIFKKFNIEVMLKKDYSGYPRLITAQRK